MKEITWQQWICWTSELTHFLVYLYLCSQRCKAQRPLMCWVPGREGRMCPAGWPASTASSLPATDCAVWTANHTCSSHFHPWETCWFVFALCCEEPCPVSSFSCQALRAGQVWLQLGSDFPGVLQVLLWVKTTSASVKLPDSWSRNICRCFFIPTNKDHSGYLTDTSSLCWRQMKSPAVPHSSWATQHLQHSKPDRPSGMEKFKNSPFTQRCKISPAYKQVCLNLKSNLEASLPGPLHYQGNQDPSKSHSGPGVGSFLSSWTPRRWDP